MNLTTKEQGLLADLKKQEQLCIDKYTKYANEACDPNLKNLFTSIKTTEEHHLNTINDILAGKTPNVNNGGSSPVDSVCTNAPTPAGCNTQNDAYLCQDALSMEKAVSSLYDISIFEFSNDELRNVLNGIQKQEQEHGKKIYDYMSNHQMY